MAAYPTPEVGLVVSFSFLWSDEAEAGQVEGRKNRPCAIILVVDTPDGKHERVTVAPITHSKPRDPTVAFEIPQAVKAHLGLDSEQSWIILNEVNSFPWPGYDLYPIDNANGPYDYGFLPPKLFEQIKARILQLYDKQAVSETPRDDVA
jgi:hypothetical protein